MNVKTIAEICHEANRILCNSVGDFSQTSWADAESWQQEAAIAGVLFLIDNPDAEPDALHNQWCNLKYEQGWVYGERKDPIAKTHPCLVKFENLPEAQQVKDHLFRDIALSLIKFLKD